MEMILWTVLLGLVIFFFALLTLAVRREVAGQEAPPPAAVGYLRRWTSRRRALARRDLLLWQEEYDRQMVARRAGGLHVSSTAAPVSGGDGIPPQGSEPCVAQGPGGGGEAGASGEPPGRKNEKFWRKLSDDLNNL